MATVSAARDSSRTSPPATPNPALPTGSQPYQLGPGLSSARAPAAQLRGALHLALRPRPFFAARPLIGQPLPGRRS